MAARRRTDAAERRSSSRSTPRRGVATITLNRPDALNALTVPMKQALLAAFRRVERDAAVRAVILTGAGRAFCAGQDLRERLQPDAAPLGVEVRERYNPIIRAMRAPARSRSSARSTASPPARARRWRWPATSGSPRTRRASRSRSGGSGSCRTAARRGSCPRLVGATRAAELALLGDPVPAADAVRLGLVGRVVPAAELATEARAVAARLAAGAPRAIALTKRALERGVGARPRRRPRVRGPPPGHGRPHEGPRRGHRRVPGEAPAAVHRASSALGRRPRRSASRSAVEQPRPQLDREPRGSAGSDRAAIRAAWRPAARELARRARSRSASSGRRRSGVAAGRRRAGARSSGRIDRRLVDRRGASARSARWSRSGDVSARSIRAPRPARAASRASKYAQQDHAPVRPRAGQHGAPQEVAIDGRGEGPRRGLVARCLGDSPCRRPRRGRSRERPAGSVAGSRARGRRPRSPRRETGSAPSSAESTRPDCGRLDGALERHAPSASSAADAILDPARDEGVDALDARSSKSGDPDMVAASRGVLGAAASRSPGCRRCDRIDRRTIAIGRSHRPPVLPGRLLPSGTASPG